MTTEKEVRTQIVNAFLKSLKVEKTFDAMGEDHQKNLPVHLEDFSVSFTIPYNTCLNSVRDKDYMVTFASSDFRIRTIQNMRNESTKET
jgi:hypothetical protein